MARKVSKYFCISLIALMFVTLSIFVHFQDNSISINTVLYKNGAKGDDIKNIQTKLKNLGYDVGSIDGIFGKKTENAVKAFQKDYGLKVDGIVGAKTLNALGLGGSSGGYSSTDLYLMARCVYGEARGEPYIGQVAVAAVILNRVKSSDFPNTISGVIYQPWAFTAVNDGQINLTPNQSAINAVNDAINGWDPTNGCLYYFNPKTATSKWIWTREIRLTIGAHNFCV